MISCGRILYSYWIANIKLELHANLILQMCCWFIKLVFADVLTSYTIWHVVYCNNVHILSSGLHKGVGEYIIYNPTTLLKVVIYLSSEGSFGTSCEVVFVFASLAFPALLA